MATTQPQPQATTEKELHSAAVQSRVEALSIAKKCGCMLCASFVDAMSKSGYASGPQGSGGRGPSTAGTSARPGLRPGEGGHPTGTDRDLLTGALNGRAMSPIEIGRLDHTTQVNQALAIMRRQGQMTLSEHLQLLGHDAGLFAFKSGVPESVIRNALDGQAIPLIHAKKIAEQINNEHGLHQKKGLNQGPALVHSDIAGLVAVHPDELK